VEGTWKCGINFHQESIPYLDSIGSESQKRLAGPELKVSHVGRWMAPQELIRDGEVNRPFVDPSGLTSAREIALHATSQEDKAWGEKRLGADVRGGRELWLYAEWAIAERKESNLHS
jgi:hypothetical protein